MMSSVLLRVRGKERQWPGSSSSFLHLSPPAPWSVNPFWGQKEKQSGKRAVRHAKLSYTKSHVLGHLGGSMKGHQTFTVRAEGSGPCLGIYWLLPFFYHILTHKSKG